MASSYLTCVESLHKPWQRINCVTFESRGQAPLHGGCVYHGERQTPFFAGTIATQQGMDNLSRRLPRVMGTGCLKHLQKHLLPGASVCTGCNLRLSARSFKLAGDPKWGQSWSGLCGRSVLNRVIEFGKSKVGAWLKFVQSSVVELSLLLLRPAVRCPVQIRPVQNRSVKLSTDNYQVNHPTSRQLKEQPSRQPSTL